MTEVAAGEFSGVVDAAPDAMLVVGTDGRIVLANRQACVVFGYARERLVGMIVEELMPPRFRDRHVEHRKVFMLNPKTRPMGTTLQIYGLRQSGEEFSADVSLAPWVASDDKMYIVVALRDVSARREQVQALDAALYQITGLRRDADTLREAVREYAEITHRGLIGATYRGIAMIIIGVMLAIFFVGLLSQSWSCDATNLAGQQGSGHYRICSVVFPQIVPQVSQIKRAAAAAAARAETERATRDVLTDVQARLAGTTPAAARTCAVLRKLDPTSPALTGCP